jgi:hypothetical protein
MHQLFVVPDGELQVTGYDTLFLVISSSVSSEFKNLSGEVFKDSGEVYWRTGTYTLGVVATFEETMNTTDWELKSGC